MNLFLPFAGRVFAATAAVCVAALTATAQVPEIEPDKSGLLRRALVTDTEAYVLLPSELVCGPRIVYLEPSRTRSHALIVRRVFSAERQVDALLEGDRNSTPNDDLWSLLQAGRADLEVLLWGPTSRRAVTLWRRGGNTDGYADVSAVHWLGESQVALVKVELVQGAITRESLDDKYKSGAPKRTYLLLRVNANTGGVETLMTSEDPFWLSVASDAPVAAVSSLSGSRLLLVRDAGALPAPLTPQLKQGESVFWSFWARGGGKEITGSADVFTKGSAGSRREIILNVETGAIREHTPQDKISFAIGDGRQKLPLDIEAQSEQVKNKDASAAIETLWLGQRDWKPNLPISQTPMTHRTLLAADADPQTETLLLSTSALFQRHGSLWATPLVKVDRDRFLAARRERFKRDTLAQAARLGEQAATEMRFGSGDLPAPDKAGWSITFFHRIERFLLNPETGKNGFTPLYSSVERSSYPDPKTARFGALSGPGGRAVIFWDGHVVWEDDVPKSGND